MELLFEGHRAALERVVAISLRKLRGSVDDGPNSPFIEVPAVVNDVPTKSTKSVGTNTEKVMHKTIRPLMSIRCQRPQRGLLGPVPGSSQW